jgi:AcrR family transcriptional regulator
MVTTATPRRLAEAAVRVVARDGFDVLSVRTVAREAGVAAGTVQHHYATRERLLLAAFDYTVEVLENRIGSSAPSGAALDEPIRPHLRRLLREMLPLDEQRRQECVVWVALTAAAAAHPELSDAHRKASLLLRTTIRGIVSAGVDRGDLPDGLDPAEAADTLAAVVDGLTLQGLSAATDTAALGVAFDSALDLLLR